jgi:hypothetical protein
MPVNFSGGIAAWLSPDTPKAAPDRPRHADIVAFDATISGFGD